MKLKQTFLLITAAFSIAACSGNSNDAGGESSNSPTPKNSLMSPITIDNTGVVPAFNDATSAVNLYLHNNSNQAIKDISYSWDLNLYNDNNHVGDAFLKMNPLSDNSLANVPANGTLTVPLHIPKIDSQLGQGAALLKISYTYNGKKYSFSHIVNFQLVDIAKDGVFLSSGAVSSSFGNSTTAYTTLYLYGSGKAGTVYDITSIKNDTLLGHIAQGDLSGSKLVARQVASIELNTALVEKDAIGKLSVKSQLARSSTSTSLRSDDGTTFDSTQNIAVKGYSVTGNSALVLPSFVPFIDSSRDTGGKIYFYNAGNESASLSSLAATAGITGLSADTNCTTGIAAGQSCSVSFSLPASARYGTGQITVNATGNDNNPVSLSSLISWYNSTINLPQFGISTDASITPVILSESNPHTGSFNATVTNLSPISINSLSLQAPTVLGGNATAQFESSSAANCSGVTLSSGGSCTYKVLLSDNTFPDSGIVSLVVNGIANGKTVSTTGYAAYKVYRSTAQLAVSFNPSQLSIFGNNTESQTSTVTITNLGTSSSADISSLNVQKIFGVLSGGTPTYSATTNCNGKSLAAGASCTESVTLSPQLYSTGVPMQGNFAYQVSANGVQPVQALAPLQMTVQSYDSVIALTGLSSSGQGSGDGKTSATQVKFLAGQNTSKKVVLTYQNQSKQASITINGVSFASLPAAWVPEYSSQDSSSCYSSNSYSGGKTLAPGVSCTITLDNNLNLLGDTNTMTNLSFALPSLIISANGSNQYSLVPNNQLGFNDSKYYANNYQAVVIDTDSIVNNGTTNAQLIVTHTASGINNGGYTSNQISEKTTITPGMYLGLPASSSCTLSNTIGAVIEICNLIEGSSISNTYPIIWGDSYTAGLDPTMGGILTINYNSSLTGKSWDYHNNTNTSTGAGVNGGSDAVTIQPKPSRFVFGAYSQWVYKSGDNSIYTYKVPESNSVFGNGNAVAYISKATSAMTGGFNAIDQLGNKVYAAAGSGQNTIVVCSFNQNTGQVSMTGCQWFKNVSAKASANLIDIMISNGYLYALDSQNGVTKCSLASDNTISSCSATATSAPTLSLGSGRQGRLMVWNGYVVYTVAGAGDYINYLGCKQETDGTLDKCQQLVLPGMSTSAISTTVLMPATSGYAYLYTVSSSQKWATKASGCVLNINAQGAFVVSNCQNNPLLGTTSPTGIVWGGFYTGGANEVIGDDYVIYYDKTLNHLIGTATASSADDGDLASGSPLVGQEFYLVPGSNNTINQPSYLNFQLRGNYWCIGSSSQFNAILGNQIAGDQTGPNGGKLIVDTLSIH